MDLFILNYIFPNNGLIINAIGGVLLSMILILAYLQHKYAKDLNSYNDEKDLKDIKKSKYYRNNLLLGALILYVLLHMINFFS